MKHIATFVLAVTLALPLIAQNSYTATYTAGDIQSDITFTALPGNSSCPAQLTVNIPAGETIDSAVVDYTYFSSLAGFGSPTMQRSQLRCITTGQAETQLAVAVNPGLTLANYHRTVTIANGPSSGPVTFEMHAGNTGLLGSPCTSLHTVNNNTWTITVHTSSGTTGLPTVKTDDLKVWFDGVERLRGTGLSTAQVKVSVYDALGRQLVQRMVTPLNGAFELALPETATGVLLVLVEQGSARIERRLVR
ncbi:MAG: hypothetical protein IT229_09735 [Flavobacteriales bacterium]|nr:hypothetical protein [Flavobacteriales bacterium]